MRMSEKRQHKGSPTYARMRRKEQTKCHDASPNQPFGDAAVLPAWSHNIHFDTLGSPTTTLSNPSVACTVFFVHQREACQRLFGLTLSQAQWHLPQQRRQALRRVCFRSNVSPVQQRVHRHQLELLLAPRFLYPQLFDRKVSHLSRTCSRADSSCRTAVWCNGHLRLHPHLFQNLPGLLRCRHGLAMP